MIEETMAPTTRTRAPSEAAAAEPRAAAGPTPLVSVVIASVNGPPSIVECIEHLLAQDSTASYEVLVVDRCGEDVREELRRRFPDPRVIVVSEAPDLSIPRLRAIGMVSARGRLIAILEDHCMVPPGWIGAIQELHRAGHQVMGGPVENGAIDRVTDWAVFFCEYASFMPPFPEGDVDSVAGSSAIYDREALDRVGARAQDEVWEFFIHGRMKELGIRFHNDARLQVLHKKEFGFGYFMSQRYHYSRSFAGMRMESERAWKKLAYAMATPLLIPLIPWRIVRTVLPKRSRRKELLLSAPLLAVFMFAYAWGEAVGALFGPGDSLRRVE
jgi:glycosyltransferase involved in cell wall biosynthesis